MRLKGASAAQTGRTGTIRRAAGGWGTAGAAVFVLISLIVFGGMLLWCTSVVATIEACRIDEMQAASKIPIPQAEFDKLTTAAALGDEESRTAAAETVFEAIAKDEMTAWAKTETTTLCRDRFKEQGIAAFEIESRASPWRGDLATLTPARRVRALKASGVDLFLINLSMALMSLGFVKKSLSQADPSLVWLFQFPVSRRLLFLSRLIENTFDNPAALITTSVAGLLLWHCGITGS